MHVSERAEDVEKRATNHRPRRSTGLERTVSIEGHLDVQLAGLRHSVDEHCHELRDGRVPQAAEQARRGHTHKVSLAELGGE
eukprot:2581943-Rhodomonas_salina.2